MTPATPSWNGRLIMKLPQPKPSKRPYQPPKMRVYGTVREITGNSGFNPNAKADGGIVIFTKTH
jgi:hypothetical protein